ncbi:MAG: hypothetical protein AAB276_08485, partial [Pseudomonadota bacterium]
RYFNVNAFYTVGNLSFGAWQALGQDLNSTVGDPSFVSGNTGDFRLQGTSPALNAGIDVLNLKGLGVNSQINLGAFVSPTQNEVIGIRGQ